MFLRVERVGQGVSASGRQHIAAAVFGSHVQQCEAVLSQKGMDTPVTLQGLHPSTASSFQSR